MRPAVEVERPDHAAPSRRTEPPRLPFPRAHHRRPRKPSRLLGGDRLPGAGWSWCPGDHPRADPAGAGRRTCQKRHPDRPTCGRRVWNGPVSAVGNVGLRPWHLDRAYGSGERAGAAAMGTNPAIPARGVADWRAGGRVRARGPVRPEHRQGLSLRPPSFDLPRALLHVDRVRCRGGARGGRPPPRHSGQPGRRRPRRRLTRSSLAHRVRHPGPAGRHPARAQPLRRRRGGGGQVGAPGRSFAAEPGAAGADATQV